MLLLADLGPDGSRSAVRASSQGWGCQALRIYISVHAHFTLAKENRYPCQERRDHSSPTRHQAAGKPQGGIFVFLAL